MSSNEQAPRHRLPPPAMRHYFLEVHEGLDIVQFIISFARRGAHTVVIVLSASGMVGNVILQHGGVYSELTWAHRIVSLSGCFIALTNGGYSGSLSAILGYTSGQIISGIVVGYIVSAGPVVLVLAAAGGNPPVIRLPLIAAAGNQRDSGATRSPNQPDN